MVCTFLTGKWAGVDTKCHLQRWLIHCWRRQLRWVLTCGDGFTNRDVRDTRYGDDVTWNGFFNQRTLEAFVDIDVLNAAGVLGAITAEDGNGLVWLKSPGEDLTDAEATKVWVDIDG